ncbi:nucleotide exchange factor GrpE [Bifidobacterium olomucense]|uniref:Protein GrpE n=1 Tax=Bifidobacterium olomucense TaxID=2675324 RepID=A0A7Y0EY61_9BIFI|nr:nucleotide exchange factor GrpE [Bifidobacterium sp. DSM 109959]NMM98588.1 nucleotide exchange factor GrpE [Bifidobacterium sp. DSM 109959]
MSEFNKDDYLNDLPDADDLANAQSSAAGTASSQGGSDTSGAAGAGEKPAADAAGAADAADDSAKAEGAKSDAGAAKSAADGEKPAGDGSADASDDTASDDTLTPLGKAKKEAAEYLEALQRERAEFINYRNRATREQERFRQHGIIDVLTALLPALDDIDRIREHSEMDDSFKAVAAKIDKAFEKFGVEKFGEKGEEFDPTKHDAILHKPDADADKETVDTVVEAGYRIGDRVIRAARVVVASPQN